MKKSVILFKKKKNHEDREILYKDAAFPDSRGKHRGGKSL
jgi:hypothetical protein